MTRHRLPAPPLVLQPTLFRVPTNSSRADRLLDLANFLRARGLLTDGGALSLGQGLQGRGGVLSLTTQDVRASAHGLTLELLNEDDPSRWSELAESYYRRYDRGKPRRPSALQRLYMEWSLDLGWQGLLEVCQTHPRLWEAIRAALPRASADTPDRRLVAVALAVHDGSDWQEWQAAYEAETALRPDLLIMLPLLPSPPPSERLRWLAEQALGLDAPAATRAAILLACRRSSQASPLVMPKPLIELTLTLLQGVRGEADPRWLGLQRTYRWPADRLAQLRGCITSDDPVHKIVYGARPGTPWLAELWDRLESLSL